VTSATSRQVLERADTITRTAVTDSVERKIGSVTVRIDRSTCIGTANCAKIAPEVFVLDDERIITFREPPTEAPRDRVVEACDVCPVDALSAFDEDGRPLLP
jgi:ferredoxin